VQQSRDSTNLTWNKTRSNVGPIDKCGLSLESLALHERRFVHGGFAGTIDDHRYIESESERYFKTKTMIHLMYKFERKNPLTLHCTQAMTVEEEEVWTLSVALRATMSP
jgi:hypothetical protein